MTVHEDSGVISKNDRTFKTGGNSPPHDDGSAGKHRQFSRRLEMMTILFGLVGAGASLAHWPWRVGAGILVGSVLAWLNYRWLDRGLGAIVSAALAQQGYPQPRVPLGVYVGFAGRYALIGGAAYAIVKFLHAPVLAIIAGLLSLGGAAMAEGLYEVFAGTT